jgi:protein-S-isoprenylcysteine O-methyltransferase Ste14
MHILDNHLIGIIILVLFSLQGLVMLFSPGSLRLQKPEAGGISWVYNLLNLFVILVATPLVAILLMKNIMEPIEFLRIHITSVWILMIVEKLGMILFFVGNILLYWSRIILKRSFRLGGVAPRSEDKFITSGPYRWIRHPMYTSILLMSLGLSLLIQSALILFLFIMLTVFVILLIPSEDAQLQKSYGFIFNKYRQKVKALVPYIY